MADRFHTIAAEGVRLTLDLAVGHVRLLEIERDGHVIRPLHVAPWVDDPALATDPDMPGNLKYLAGDFFCAPFGKSDVEASPGHGWPANSAWRHLGDARFEGGVTATFLLERKVMGARLEKRITLRDFHPFAYQAHVFTGGTGAVSAASHAMTRFAATGRLAFSPKAFAELPTTQQESDPARGRSRFAAGVRFADLASLPLADGSTADLHRYPVAEGHEDFIMLVEAPDSPLGWTAALRPQAGDIMLSLKNPGDYPVTFLWFSNGGRFYSPWNGRHVGVLGIEEGRAYSGYGHAASVAPNPLSDAGIPTSVTLGGTVELRHAVGGLPLPAGWQAVTGIETSPRGLVLTGDGGRAEIPFDRDFLRLGPV
jgi:hypothetical protein